MLREIYRQFPKPQPDPQVKGSGKAIAAGEKACKGKTPLEVKEEFIEESKLLQPQAEMVAKLPKYEKEERQNGSYPAGQLGALVYERSLPEDQLAQFGYQGCVYSLASGLKHRLAPGGNG